MVRDDTGTGDRADPGGEGFDAFVRAATPSLYRSAVLLCGDPHLAQDLVQEALTKVYLAWGRGAGAGRIENPVAYARTTLVRTFISSRRRRSAAERPVDTAGHDGGAGDDADVVGLAERVDLRAILAALAPADRAVLVLRFFLDCSVADTAAALSLTETAVRTRTRRALDRTRHLLGPDTRLEA
ncbi:sigma-70 family RNA polymerase sigma factor [Nocardioides sp.]|uniref:sigma-70 family RNA polymerase sigma factor n=1 Tax=Nocardioides sp. TaxID=35761 RepID=UPI0035194244